MAHEWRDASLGEVIELKRGYDLPQQHRRTGRVPIVSSSGVTDHHAVAMVKGPGVVTGRYGTLGQVFYIREDFWPLNTTLYVRDFKGNDPQFISYFLRGLDFLAYSDKAAVPGLNRNHLHQARVRIPTELSEQRAIAHILGTLDDKIELNRRMNDTLEAMARALFKSWFVDFDPVRAKAEGRDPGLPKEITDLFSDHFEDSELGNIPAGWRVGNVEEFATMSRDGINPGDFPDETFDHFSIPAFDEDRKPKSELGSTIKSNKFLVPPNAVLLSKLNPRIPRIWLPVVRDNHRAICSTEFLVTVPRTGTSRGFLYSFLSSKVFADVFETLVTGTSGSHQRVKPEGLLAMNAIIPAEPVIHQFKKVMRPLLARVARARDESMTLAALRDTLLPKLTSGELQVKDTERIMTEV
jgi:type I restriction enzyme S subunit